MLEENKMYEQNKESNKGYYRVYNKIPFSLISDALNEDKMTSKFLISEFAEIDKAYEQFYNGVNFESEGSNGDYIPSNLKYKKAANLIKKEARFMFCETPDINVNILGEEITKDTKSKEELAKIDDLFNKVIESNMLESKFIQAAKDCFIGKRVAMCVNFNETTGITIEFITSQNFIYKMRDGLSNILENITLFEVINESDSLEEKRIFKKRYELETENGKDVCYVEEAIYDGAGNLIEETMKYQKTLLTRIPCVVILNDALTGDIYGTSEIQELASSESYYNKLSNSDIDSQRKGMHQIKYTIDMSPESTNNLSTAPGSYWDLVSDENMDNKHPTVGTIDPSMSYSEPLDKTLKRIDQSMYDAVDMPNISLESMVGTITSGKAMKVLYWPLIMRTKEKFKVWGPAISYIFSVLIEGAIAYPKIAKKYIDEGIISMPYEVTVVQNLPLPEDEEEEKILDISEVNAQVMSKKSYMKKWRQLTDNEANEELKQIALERQLLEDSQFETQQQYNDDNAEVQV